ncbi:MAG: hypothetical protein FWG38_03055 [Defluviitaleaceae bacterium]|nr:hypothetical protein [Defluviitaleaceae bacterium]
MVNLDFRMIDGNLHITDYPTADKILELPDDHMTKRLKDMTLHMVDLIDAKNFILAYDKSNVNTINQSLLQRAIINYYKCFGSSNGRHNALNKSQIFKGFSADAKNCFAFFQLLRNKFVAHDDSRYAEAKVGVVINSKTHPPFIDVVSLSLVAHIATPEYFQPLFNLVVATLEWVEKEIDRIKQSLISDYKKLGIESFETFNAIQYVPPTDFD